MRTLAYVGIGYVSLCGLVATVAAIDQRRYLRAVKKLAAANEELINAKAAWLVEEARSILIESDYLSD